MAILLMLSWALGKRCSMHGQALCRWDAICAGPMRVFVFVSLFAATVGTAAFAYDPYPFQRSDGKWGYVNDDHCWVIESQFEDSKAFSEGLAEVKITDDWGYIDKTGSIVIPPQFSDYVGSIDTPKEKGLLRHIVNGTMSFSEGLAAVQVGEKWGFINKNGDMVINPNFLDLGGNGFHESLAFVFINGKYGFIDKTGAVAINPQFSLAFDYFGGFSEGLAAVKIGE